MPVLTVEDVEVENFGVASLGDDREVGVVHVLQVNHVLLEERELGLLVTPEGRHTAHHFFLLGETHPPGLFERAILGHTLAKHIRVLDIIESEGVLVLLLLVQAEVLYPVGVLDT